MILLYFLTREVARIENTASTVAVRSKSRLVYSYVYTSINEHKLMSCVVYSSCSCTNEKKLLAWYIYTQAPPRKGEDLVQFF